VCTLERKLGGVVVERLDLAPFGFAVAIVAFFAKAPLMRIFRFMTVEAASGRLAKFHRWQVAPCARHRLVRVAELEIRECMIERLAVQLHDVGIASLVIGMAMVAFLLCRIWLAPMESLARRAIRGSVLVAVEAEPRLGFSRKRLVTFSALFLKLGMSVDDWPRHDKSLEQILRLRGGR